MLNLLLQYKVSSNYNFIIIILFIFIGRLEANEHTLGETRYKNKHNMERVKKNIAPTLKKEKK